MLILHFRTFPYEGERFTICEQVGGSRLLDFVDLLQEFGCPGSIGTAIFIGNRFLPRM